MGPEFFSYEPRIIFIIKVVPIFFTTYVFELKIMKLNFLPKKRGKNGGTVFGETRFLGPRYKRFLQYIYITI